MKKFILLFSVAIMAFSQTDAQKLKDKLNKATGKEESAASSESTTADATSAGNQYAEAKKFLEGEKRIYLSETNGEWKIDLSRKSYTEEFYNKLIKDGSGNVIEAKNLKINDPESPLYYKHEHYSNYDAVIFLDGFAYECKVEMPSGTVSGLYRAYTTKKIGLTSSFKTDEILNKLNEYIKNNRGGYDAKITANEEAQKKAAEEKKKAESIEGLDVVSIKLIPENDAKDIKYNGVVGFNVEATLKDGTKKITPNGSMYMSAYKFNIEGVDLKVMSSTGSVSLGYNYVTNDQLTVTVSLVSNPKLTSKTNLNVLPDAVVFSGDKFSFGAKHTLGESWWNKIPDARVEIKPVKSTTTGEDLIAYKIFFGSATEPNYAFKVKANEYVKVHTDASNSTTGSNVSATEKGYDAGNIKVIMDPSVPETINFVTSAKGGTKKGGNGVTSMSGNDGKIETVKAKVSW